MKTYLIIAALILAVAVGAAFFANPSAQAVAAEQSNETGLGGVKLVVKSGDVEASVQKLREAATSAGWTASNLEAPNEIILSPPENYNPTMFGALLEAFEQTGLQNFGLQLLDKTGRAIGPDGQPVGD